MPDRAHVDDCGQLFAYNIHNLSNEPAWSTSLLEFKQQKPFSFEIQSLECITLLDFGILKSSGDSNVRIFRVNRIPIDRGNEALDDSNSSKADLTI